MVGGGLAGVASAVRLAKLRHDVTLVERRPTVGGAVGTLEHDGFRWDTGPAATALPAVLRDLFRKSGRQLEREAELVPVDPLREHRFPDGIRIALPGGSRAAQLAAVDDALGPGPGRRWVDHVHAFADTWDRLRRDWLERPYVEELAAPETRALLRDRTTMARHVSAHLADPRLRAMAAYPAAALGQDPRRLPAWFGVLDYVEQNFGSWTFPDGFGRLATLFERRLAERRVTVLTSTVARDVAMAADRPRGVVTDQGPVDAEVVVVAVDPRHLPALARHVRRTTPVAPPSVTHLGLVDAPALAREVVFHGSAAPLVLRTAGTAPEGGAAWTVLGREADLLTALAKRGVDVRDRVRTRVDRSPQALLQEHGGSPFGVRWAGRSTVRRRLGTVTPLPGVYAAGAHTGGGGWLPFVGLTAALVAEQVGPAR